MQKFLMSFGLVAAGCWMCCALGVISPTILLGLGFLFSPEQLREVADISLEMPSPLVIKLRTSVLLLVFDLLSSPTQNFDKSSTACPSNMWLERKKPIGKHQIAD